MRNNCIEQTERETALSFALKNKTKKQQKNTQKNKTTKNNKKTTRNKQTKDKQQQKKTQNKQTNALNYNTIFSPELLIFIGICTRDMNFS